MNDLKTDKYLRDESAGALLSRDHAGLAAYKARKKQSNLIDEVCNDINSVKQDLADIKEALKEILDR